MYLSKKYKKVNFLVIGASDDGGGTNAIWNVNSFGQLVDNTNALSGISFFYSSGNITAGNFKLYGIKSKYENILQYLE